MRSIVCIVVLLPVLFMSCSRVEGSFAFKKFQDTSFKKYRKTKEFSSQESVRWMFTVAKEITSPLKLGVILQKRELIWVSVSSRVELLHRTRHRIYGTIENYDPGLYKILITNVKAGNSVVGQCSFRIFKEDN
jgi:hypothetical protein